MTKLSDTQLVILSAASQRADRNLLPPPVSLKGGAAQKVMGSLLGKGLAEEVEATRDDPVWRTDEDGRRFTLRATGAAFEALGIELDGPNTRAEAGNASTSGEKVRTATQAAARGKEQGNGPGDPIQPQVAPAARKAAAGGRTRADSKQARLIAMLKQPEGASIGEIVAATGWQPHTVRGAIAGALKKKLGLAVASEKLEGRGRVYRITGRDPA